MSDNKIKITKEDIISCLCALRFDRIDGILYSLVCENLINSGKFEIVDADLTDKFNKLFESVHTGTSREFYRLRENKTIYSDYAYEDKQIIDVLDIKDSLLSYLVDRKLINFISLTVQKYNILKERNMLDYIGSFFSTHELTILHSQYVNDQISEMTRK